MCKHIVCIGGGNGLSNLLSELKDTDFQVTAIVSVMDSGGSTGKIRKRYNVIAFGDIRRALAALCASTSEVSGDCSSTSEVKSADTSEVGIGRIKKNFNYRYKSGKNKGHTVGNLFLLNLFKKYGSEKKAIKKASEILDIKEKVLPVTLDNVSLVARINSGKEIIGEDKIDTVRQKLDIKKIYLKPRAKINPEVLQEIKKADIIIIGPGDLYTSVLCNFAVDGLKQAVKKSKAKKIWINNLTNKLSETKDFRLTNYLDQIDKYIGKSVIDYVLYQSEPVGKDPIKNNLRTEELKNVRTKKKIQFIGDDFAEKKGKGFVHNGKKVIEIIKKIKYL